METKPNLVEERATEATPKAATTLQNVALTFRLILGALIFALLFWYVDSHITK